MAKLLAREVDLCLYEVLRPASQDFPDTSLLVLLRWTVIDFEDLHILQKLPQAVGSRVKSCSQDDHLSGSATDGAHQPLVDKLRADEMAPDTPMNSYIYSEPLGDNRDQEP